MPDDPAGFQDHFGVLVLLFLEIPVAFRRIFERELMADQEPTLDGQALFHERADREFVREATRRRS